MAIKKRTRVLLIGLSIGLLVSFIVGSAWYSQRSSGSSQKVSSSAPSMPESGGGASVVHAYTDNGQCLACHANQAQQWQGSHHAKAMALAGPESVRGRFDGAEFKHQGVTSRFFQREGKYMVRTDGPDGKLADFEVAYTFGVAPLQQYLIAQPGGRLQALQIAWDDVQKRWFHLQPKEKAPAGDVLHWTGRYQTANTMCIACHTTGYEKRYDAVRDSFDSRWKEPNVSCQACHGPGQAHVDWARLKVAGKAATLPAGSHFGFTVDQAKASAKQQVQMCASCHSHRVDLTDGAHADVPLFDQHTPALLSEGLYHADGQQLDEVFVYGSFRQSKMYQKGVSCTDCHNAHTGRLKLPGNATCLQCHGAAQNSRFPSAAGNYDSPAHHFHRAGSAGAQCAACHMPSKNYMQIQARPDHSLRVPRPDLTVKLGLPNACTQCHADKPAQWAADKVAQWYGSERRSRAHYGEVFAAAREGQPVDAALAELAADLQQPAIVRATALASLRQGGLEQAVAASRDPDEAVRTAAAEALESAPVPQRLQTLTPLLKDPLRSVRIAAARGLMNVPREQIPGVTQAALDQALAEYIEVQKRSLDMPGARLNLAVVLASKGQVEQAEQHYLAALKIDPDFTPARANLAQLYNAGGRNGEAVRLLQEGLKRRPDIGELQYSLGLLLAEEARLPEAAKSLAKAAQLMPKHARAHLNSGLALLQTGQGSAAERALSRAYELDPGDPSAAQALAVHYVQSRQFKLATVWAQRWTEAAPADPQANRLWAELRAMAAR